MSSVRRRVVGGSFINNGRAGIFECITAITNLVGDDWDADEFHTAVEVFIVRLESFFLDEEIILKNIHFQELDTHTVLHREILLRAMVEIVDVIDQNDAVEFLTFLYSEISNHELLEDVKYTGLFDIGG